MPQNPTKLRKKTIGTYIRTCTHGFKLTNGKCVQIICKPGTKLDTNNKCVSVCNKDDEKWDSGLMACVKTKCPHGYKLTNGKCIKIICKPGTKLGTSNKCESICNTLNEKWDKKANSYWIKRDKRAVDKKQYEKLY